MDAKEEDALPSNIRQLPERDVRYWKSVPRKALDKGRLHQLSLLGDTKPGILKKVLRVYMEQIFGTTLKAYASFPSQVDPPRKNKDMEAPAELHQLIEIFYMPVLRQSLKYIFYYGFYLLQWVSVDRLSDIEQARLEGLKLKVSHVPKLIMLERCTVHVGVTGDADCVPVWVYQTDPSSYSDEHWAKTPKLTHVALFRESQECFLGPEGDTIISRLSVVEDGLATLREQNNAFREVMYYQKTPEVAIQTTPKIDYSEHINRSLIDIDMARTQTSQGNPDKSTMDAMTNAAISHLLQAQNTQWEQTVQEQTGNEERVREMLQSADDDRQFSSHFRGLQLPPQYARRAPYPLAVYQNLQPWPVPQLPQQYNDVYLRTVQVICAAWGVPNDLILGDGSSGQRVAGYYTTNTENNARFARGYQEMYQTHLEDLFLTRPVYNEETYRQWHGTSTPAQPKPAASDKSPSKNKVARLHPPPTTLQHLLNVSQNAHSRGGHTYQEMLAGYTHSKHEEKDKEKDEDGPINASSASSSSTQRSRPAPLYFRFDTTDTADTDTILSLHREGLVDDDDMIEYASRMINKPLDTLKRTRIKAKIKEVREPEPVTDAKGAAPANKKAKKKKP